MTMSALPTPRPRATLDDLMGVEGKAELIGGRIVRYMAAGHLPGVINGRIFRKLADHVDAMGHGVAHPPELGYAVPTLPSGRQSFCPDVSYYDGPLPTNPMKFISGAPTFAVEVRSENSYGPSADLAIAAKRADYFAAGTQVVWDVDPVNGWIDCYRASDPTNPARFTRGQDADAEPAVPAWRLSVDWLFA
jgi:Uma2 family endonuclease